MITKIWQLNDFKVKRPVFALSPHFDYFAVYKLSNCASHDSPIIHSSHFSISSILHLTMGLQYNKYELPAKHRCNVLDPIPTSVYFCLRCNQFFISYKYCVGIMRRIWVIWVCWLLTSRGSRHHYHKIEQAHYLKPGRTKINWDFLIIFTTLKHPSLLTILGMHDALLGYETQNRMGSATSRLTYIIDITSILCK